MKNIKTITYFIIVFLSINPVHAASRHVVNLSDGSSKTIELTLAQQSARDAERDAWLAEKPIREWQDQMDIIELYKDLENIIGALDATTRARIPGETLDKYNAKKALRLSKP